MTGQHARRSPTGARVLTAAAAFLVLGLGAWAGSAMRQPDADLTSPTANTSVPVIGVSEPPAPSTSTSADAMPSTATPTDSPSAPSAAEPSTQPSAVAGAPTPDSAVLAYEEQVVGLVNAERAAAGCPALTVDARLVSAARGHSADMAARGYFDHTTPDGVTFDARITRAGYAWSLVAENIAAGQRDPAAVMASWMGSDGHRRNILNCRLQHIGVGLAYDGRGRPHWTQDFGAQG